MPKYNITLSVDVEFVVLELEAPDSSQALRRARNAFENTFTPRNVSEAFAASETEIADWNMECTFQNEEIEECEDGDAQ